MNNLELNTKLMLVYMRNDNYNASVVVDNIIVKDKHYRISAIFDNLNGLKYIIRISTIDDKFLGMLTAKGIGGNSIEYTRLDGLNMPNEVKQSVLKFHSELMRIANE